MRSMWWKAAVAAAALGPAGCAPPVVGVRHILPAAMPLPGDVAIVRAGDFTVRSGPGDGFGGFLKETLDKRLTDVPVGLGYRGPAARITEDQRAVVGGVIDVEMRDESGKRTVRRAEVATGTLQEVELPTLVRTASVRVEFQVRRAAGGADLGTVEVRRTYSSAADPAVRGELGLERADDPARVPPVGKIVRGLLADCAEAFARMIAPVPVQADVPLRAAPGRHAELGIEAARRADWYEAVRQFDAAATAAPDDLAAHFDLAVAAEASGRLPLANRHYQRAWDLSGQKDEEAKSGADRTRRILAARAPRTP